MPLNTATLPEMLARRAATSPDKVAFSFLADGETLTETVTFAELEQRVLSLAGHLHATTKPGDRVLLIYPPGIDYVVAVMGCLRSGRIAVPAYPPKPRRPDARLAAIVADCAPTLTLTDRETFDKHTARGSAATEGDTAPLALPALTSWPHDASPTSAPGAVPPMPGAQDVALLQYTSGSTADPKGVVLTHANLVANIGAIQTQFGLHEEVVGLSWLPPYHDMGLIGFVLGAAYIGCHLILMPPVAFIQRPMRWLKAIETYRVCTTGAPNFGYEQCVKKIAPAERAGLDLRSWKRALNGAEPVSATTLREFAAAFAESGFDAQALAPCYGLAEATLLVSGKPPQHAPVVVRVDESLLAAHEAHALTADDARGVDLVSSGRVAPGTQVIIVDVDSAMPLPDGRVGEICIASPSVTRGYWNATVANVELFIERGGVTYLRSGDLGFFVRGELFVTGRLKDLIILRGRNHYPQDIEQTVSGAHALVQSGAAAAFSVTRDGREQLVVVVEVTRAFRPAHEAEVTAAITNAVAAQHDVVAHAVTLLRPAHLPRTSSGKVRRRACRQMWLDDTLPVAVEREAPTPVVRHGARSTAKADALIAWVRDYGAHRINSRLIDERRTIPPYVVLDFGNHGLMGLQVAEQFGGLDLSNVDALRVMEQVAAIDLTLASFLGVHQALGTRPIKHFATSAQQQALLPSIAAGRELAAFAITEPNAGSNPLALQTKAIAQPDGSWKLYGVKEWIGLASWAGVITVFAQLYDGDSRPQGITAFVVKQGTPGLRHGPEALTMGVRGMVQNRLFLEGVPVTTADMLGAPGDGMTVAQDAMMYGRLGLGVMSLAAMKRSAQLMLRYATARTISTGRLLDNPVTLARLNAHTSAICATECLVYDIARWLDAGVSVPAELFMTVKITAPELLGRTVDDLVQLLGGRGYIEPNLVPQMLRDARLIRIFEGPTETLTMALGVYLSRNAEPVLAFVNTHMPRGAVSERLRAIIDRCRPSGRAPNSYLVYQLGDYAAYAIMLAATLQHTSSVATAQAVVWLERLLVEKEAAMFTRGFADVAPATAHDLTTRVAQYAHSIGNDTECQQLAGEEHTPDGILFPSAPAVVHASVPAPAAPVPAAHNALPARSVAPRGAHDELVAYLASLLELQPEQIDADKPLVHFGLDSLRLVELQFHVEQTYGYTVAPEAFFNQLTLKGLLALIGGTESPVPVPVTAEPAERGKVDFSIFFFSDGDSGQRANPYQLVIDAARYADANGFKAVWVPERHFHQFGGLYPNPSVVASALSMVTKRLRLRAGSVVLPLHHPARVAEEWAVVDNLSGGRVDLAFTPGWSVNDFALANDRYANRLDSMFEGLRTFETLWRGGTGAFRNGAGETVELAVFPRPRHPDRTVWLTCTRGRERFEKAGEIGANVLTALLMQTVDELAENIAAYRESRARHGFDPDGGEVTVMLHTYIGEDLDTVRALVREPLHDYIMSSVQLWGMTEKSLEQLQPAERERLIDLALERYLRTCSLIGTVESTRETVDCMYGMGVTEIACLIDFGIDDTRTLQSLRAINVLREQFAQREAPQPFF